ncbi:DsbA family protein [Massilia sp. IC2-477]|uniref:DsbA family protein n=1 Tax=unclassified Massilia TaxID=2609279 RepID=UPI001D1109BA|nr:MULTISPECIES: thioredoxin domain-containing protein [unclassified Massilia]MCC2954597.1 DsbA family protein [Massilia sp. IC2-477]MCC2972014.1 DsbA family protein [Massilia sp. IC2-476]
MSQLQITENDHVRGRPDADIVIVEYGDFQCPYCARAHPTLVELQQRYGERLALVYRHLPLGMHPFAEGAAEAAEAAGAQGKFWQMHDALFEHQAQMSPAQLPLVAQQLGIENGRFQEDLAARRYREQIRAQADEGKALGASGTPSFFINGERYHGDSDRESLTAAVEKYL